MQTFKKIVSCLMILVSCSTIFSTAGCRSLQSVIEKSVSDSTEIDRTVVPRDTTLKTAPASVSVAVYIPCPDQKTTTPQPNTLPKPFKPIEKQFKNAKLKVWMEGNKMMFDCQCDTVAIKAKLYNTYQKEKRSRREASTRTVVVEKKFVPPFVNFLAWSGGILWVIIILAVLLHLFTPIKFFKK